MPSSSLQKRREKHCCPLLGASKSWMGGGMEQCVHHWLRPAATLWSPPGEESAHHQRPKLVSASPPLWRMPTRQGAVTRSRRGPLGGGRCIPAAVPTPYGLGIDGHVLTVWRFPIVVPTTCGPMEQSDGVAAASGAVPLTCRRTFQSRGVNLRSPCTTVRAAPSAALMVRHRSPSERVKGPPCSIGTSQQGAARGLDIVQDPVIRPEFSKICFAISSDCYLLRVGQCPL